VEQEAFHRGRSRDDQTKRIAIIAECSVVIEAIKLGLSDDGRFEVLGRVNADEVALQSVLAAEPDVVLVDDMLDSPDALDVIAAIRSRCHRVLILLLTIRPDGGLLDSALAAGATAVISKNISPASLGVVVRETIAGKLLHLSARLEQSETRRPAHVTSAAASHLTSRELEILRLMAAGRTNGQIAEQLCVAEQTVKFHVANVLRKLHVANRTQASHYAHLHGLVDSAEDEGTPVSQEGVLS
jgi:DNA-binding NarL/FixJ family response regulator